MEPKPSCIFLEPVKCSGCVLEVDGLPGLVIAGAGFGGQVPRAILVGCVEALLLLSRSPARSDLKIDTVLLGRGDHLVKVAGNGGIELATGTLDDVAGG